MKKLLLISMLIGAMPLSLMAQDDDLYFVSKKKSAEKVVDNELSAVTYSGSDRNVDEYNRRLQSSYQVIDGDTTTNDIIAFSAEKGVYPDSLKEDYVVTRNLSRFYDYELADNAAFWAGYRAGVDTWAWHSPWYYSRYGWYSSWYDPWYDPWFDPWYDPWYRGYYGYYGYYRGWYDPWYWGGYPYRYHYYPVVVGRQYAHIGTGSIRRNGTSHGYYHGGGVSSSSSRLSSLRSRTSRMSRNSGSYSNRSGNRERSGSGNFSGYRGNSNSSYSGSRSSSSGSFGGSRSSGGFGGSRGGGGGGGSRMGGRR